jgi:hypothetical protein
MIRMLREYPSLFANLLEELRDRAERNEQAHPDFSGIDKFHDPLKNEDQQEGYLRALDDLKKILCGDQELMKQRLVELYTYVPEIPFPREKSIWHGEEVDPSSYEDCPFFTEHYLYDLMGKEDARSILGHLRRVVEASGVDDMELRREVNRVYEARKAATARDPT